MSSCLPVAKKAHVARILFLLSSVLSWHPFILTVTWADGQSQPCTLQLRKLRLRDWWACSRLHVSKVHAGCSYGWYSRSLEGLVSSLWMPHLPHPSVYPLCSNFPQELTVLCILNFSQNHSLWGVFQGGCYGTEKQGEQREDPTGLSRHRSGMNPSHTHIFLVLLFKKKDKVCGRWFVPKLDVQGLLRASSC